MEREERRRLRALRIERLEADVERCRLELILPLDSYREHRDEPQLIERYGLTRQRLCQLRSEQEDDRDPIFRRFLFGAALMALFWIAIAIVT